MSLLCGDTDYLGEAVLQCAVKKRGHSAAVRIPASLLEAAPP